MLPTPEPRDPLEPLIDRTLRAQPPRRAPRTLEARVLAELARRAALPWWHKSYAHWPAAVRGAFFVLSALAAALLVAGVFLLTHTTAPADLAGEIAGRFEGFATLREIVATVAAKSLVLWRAIPPLWLYSAVALAAAGYATLVGVGAAAYRAFVAPR
jgi:hypothetical protein